MGLKDAIEYTLSSEESSAMSHVPEQWPIKSDPPAGLTSREDEVLKLAGGHRRDERPGRRNALPQPTHRPGAPQLRLPQDRGRLPHRGHPLRPGTRPGLTAVSTQRSAVSFLFWLKAENRSGHLCP